MCSTKGTPNLFHCATQCRGQITVCGYCVRAYAQIRSLKVEHLWSLYYPHSVTQTVQRLRAKERRRRWRHVCQLTRHQVISLKSKSSWKFSVVQVKTLRIHLKRLLSTCFLFSCCGKMNVSLSDVELISQHFTAAGGRSFIQDSERRKSRSSWTFTEQVFVTLSRLMLERSKRPQSSAEHLLLMIPTTWKENER